MRGNRRGAQGMIGPFITISVLAHAYEPPAHGAEPPPLSLAKNYIESETNLDEYWASEKYDGVRAYWNGARLLTRAGNTIHAPNWFTEVLPPQALDGELWIGRGRFEQLISTVRAEVPDDLAWSAVRFMIFDLPGHGGDFDARKRELTRLLSTVESPWVRLVPHWRITDHQALLQQRDRIVAAGGEGLMLQRGAALYHAARSDDLLKVKRFEDAEARVIAHVPGKGKYEGVLGAVEVERADGLRFRIGTGFSDEERRQPPPVGTWITYRYHGTTQGGVPKFASFLRVRQD